MWKSYIDFEVGEIDPDSGDSDSEEEGVEGKGRGRVRRLYERLTRQSGHWKVWIAWALFEGTEVRVGEEEDEDEEGEGGGGVKIIPGNPVKAREIFKKGYEELKLKGEVESVSTVFLFLAPNSLFPPFFRTNFGTDSPFSLPACRTPPNMERIRRNARKRGGSQDR